MDALSGSTPRGLARRITQAFQRGELDLSLRPSAPKPGWEALPEVAVADRLREAGATDTDVRLFVTFTAAMDRARDADRLWRASGRLFLENRWPFQPEEVADRSLQDLALTLRSYGVSQRHGVDSAGWHTIATSIVGSEAPPVVRTAIYDGTGNARELLRELLEEAKRQAVLPTSPRAENRGHVG